MQGALRGRRVSSSVTFSVRTPPWWRPAWLLLHVGVAVLMVAWAALLWSQDAWARLAFVALAAVGWGIGIGWHPRSGELRFDGQRWTLTALAAGGRQECEGSLSLAIDAGSWMLLRFRPEVSARRGAGALWLLAGRRESAHDWAALRRAVYSPRSDPAGPSAQAAAPPSA